MKKKISPKLIIIVLGASLILSSFITYSYMTIERKAKHEQLNALLTTQATQMTNSVNQALSQVYSLQALVLGNHGENIDLETIGQFLIQEEYKRYVRNILVAPDGIVTQVYPLTGNENVIGLDLYSQANRSFEAAIAAQKTGKLTVTGPYDLVQGGQAISGRLFVQVPQNDGSSLDWGLVSVTLAFPEVMENTATDMLEDMGYAYRVFRENKDADEHAELLNRGFQEGHGNETLQFSIQTMDFELQAYPVAGWNDAHKDTQIFLSLFVGLFISAFGAYFIVHRQITLKENATKDAMTGLWNRLAGMRKINQRLKDKHFSKGAFLLLDIDHFKSVNDTLGHQTGDEILIESAKMFQAIFRSNDIVCRLGGDEFVIYLDCPNGCDFLDEKTQQLQNAMRRSVHGTEHDVNISCSVGIAIGPDCGRSFDELYTCADKALYHSKESGRDCTTIYSDTLA